MVQLIVSLSKQSAASLAKNPHISEVRYEQVDVGESLDLPSARDRWLPSPESTLWGS
jgi:hypothetical protein